MAHGDLQLFRLLARLLREETDKTGRDAVCRLRRESDGLARDARDRDAADVAPVREFHKILVGQWHGYSSFCGVSYERRAGRLHHAGRWSSARIQDYSAPKNSSSTAMQSVW